MKASEMRGKRKENRGVDEISVLLCGFMGIIFPL